MLTENKLPDIFVIGFQRNKYVLKSSRNNKVSSNSDIGIPHFLITEWVQIQRSFDSVHIISLQFCCFAQ